MIRMREIYEEGAKLAEVNKQVLLTMSPTEFVFVFELLKEGISKAHIDRQNDAATMLKGLNFEFVK